MRANMKKSLGSLFSPPDVRDHVARSTQEVFPEKFKLTMPAVKNQGNVSSCVAHAISLVTEYYHKKETNQTIKMSTGYIYGNRLIAAWKGEGMYTRDAIKSTVKFGNVPKELFQENIEVPEAVELFDSRYNELEEKGLPFRLKEYFRLKDVNSIKATLLEGNPVIFTMTWFSDITFKDGVMITSGKRCKGDGGHCMVIYGWNETGWLVQNSWGTNWQNKGKFVLPFNVPVKEFWGVADISAEESSLIIHTPFKSPTGKAIAKILNMILVNIYKLFKKEDN